MLQFYYDFMDVFEDHRDFPYCIMDTDSAYMALSTDTLEEVVKPHLRQKYILEKNDWLPRDDTPEHAAYDKRTPGLFKEEYRGDGIVALCSKTYYCFGVEDKVSCKGINKCLNDIHKGTYMDVLLSKNPDPVSTEVSVSLTIKCIHIYKRELGSPISTIKEKY